MCGLPGGYLGEASEGAGNIDWEMVKWSSGLSGCRVDPYTWNKVRRRDYLLEVHRVGLGAESAMGHAALDDGEGQYF